MPKSQQSNHEKFLKTSELNRLIKMHACLDDIEGVLKSGADVLYNLKEEKRYSTQSQTALHFAVRTHNSQVLEVLLEEVGQYDASLFISLHKLNLNSSPDIRSKITAALNQKETELTGSQIAKATATFIAKVEFEVDVEFETNLHSAIRAKSSGVLTDLLEEVIEYDESLFVSLHELNLKFNTKASSDKRLTAIGNKITALLNKRETELTGSPRAKTKAKLYSAIHADDPKVLASLLEEITETEYDKNLFISLHELNLKLGIKASSDKSFTAIGNKITAVLNKREAELTGSKIAEAEAKVTAELYSAIRAGNSELLAQLLKKFTTYDESLFKSLYSFSINAPADIKDEIIVTLIRTEAKLTDSPKYIESQARALPLPNSIDSQKEEKIEKEGKKSDRFEGVTSGERKVEMRSESKVKNEFALKALDEIDRKTSTEIKKNESFLSSTIKRKDELSRKIQQLSFWETFKEYVKYKVGYPSLRHEIEKCNRSIMECKSFLSRKKDQIIRIKAALQRLGKDVSPTGQKTDIVSTKQEQQKQEAKASKPIIGKWNEIVFQKIISGVKDWKHLDKNSQQNVRILVEKALKASCQHPISEQVILKIREKITKALYNDTWGSIGDDVQEKRKGVYIEGGNVTARLCGIFSSGETLTCSSLVKAIEAGAHEALSQRF